MFVGVKMQVGNVSDKGGLRLAWKSQGGDGAFRIGIGPLTYA